MALPSSGKISLLDVRTELKKDGKISLNDSDVRKLAGKESSQISMSDFYGKSNQSDIYMKDVYYGDDRWNDIHPITNVISTATLNDLNFNVFSTDNKLPFGVITKKPIELDEYITLYFENDLIGVQTIDFKKDRKYDSYSYLYFSVYKNFNYHKFKLYYDRKDYMYTGKALVRFHLAKTGVDIGLKDKLGEIMRFGSMVEGHFGSMRGYYFVKESDFFESKIKIENNKNEPYSFIASTYNFCKLIIIADRTDFPKEIYVVLHHKEYNEMKAYARFILTNDKIKINEPIVYYPKSTHEYDFIREQLVDQYDQFYISILQTIDYEDNISKH